MDRYGRRPVLLLGVATFAVSYGLIIFATSVPTIFALRLLTGAALAATVSSMFAMIADIAPPARRGEATGYYSVIGTGAMAIGPMAGTFILNAYGFTTMFLSAAAVLALALFIALPIPETLSQPAVRQNSNNAKVQPTIGTKQLLRIVWLPSLVMFTVATVFFSMQAFVAVYGLDHGVENPSIFFTVCAILLMITRLFAGRLSDRFGRRAVLLPGVLLVVVAPAVLAIDGTLPAIVISAALMGVGFGSSQIGLMTLTVDSVSPANRGAAVGYFQSAFELGIGFGSIVLGIVAQALGFQGMFLVASLVPLTGFFTFIAMAKGHSRYVEAANAMPRP
jgi:MFS family permease